MTRLDIARPLVTAKLVEVPFVIKVVARVVEPVNVDEAFERKPLLKAMVVEVEFSPVPRVVNGKAKVDPPDTGHVVLHVSPVRHNVVTARVVDVALVVVEFTALKFVKVDDAVDTKPFWNTSVVDVACSPVPSVVKGYANDPAPLVGHVVLHISPVRQIVVEVKLGMVTLPVKPFTAIALLVDVARLVGLDVAR